MWRLLEQLDAAAVRADKEVAESLLSTPHGSTPTPGFLISRDETQTMVQAKLRPKLRPRQTLYLPGKGETQTMV